MSTQLYHDSLRIERFYAQDVGAFYDEVGSMLRFAGTDHSDDLEHHDCVHQLLNGIDGRFILLFGGLERIKSQLDQEGFEELSLAICRAFYLVKRADYHAYATTIHQMDEILAQSVRRKKAANDK